LWTSNAYGYYLLEEWGTEDDSQEMESWYTNGDPFEEKLCRRRAAASATFLLNVRQFVMLIRHQYVFIKNALLIVD